MTSRNIKLCGLLLILLGMIISNNASATNVIFEKYSNPSIPAPMPAPAPLPLPQPLPLPF